DPQDVAKLANAVVDLHLERTDMLATTGLRQTTEFVRQEREKAALELRNAADRLVNYRKEHRVVELAAEREARMKENIDPQAKVREAEKNVTTSQAQVQEMRAAPEKEPANLPQEDLKENPRIAELRLDLRKLKTHRNELLQQFQPSNPEIQSVDRQIADLQKEIGAEPPEIATRSHAPNLARATLRTKLEELQAALQG